MVNHFDVLPGQLPQLVTFSLILYAGRRNHLETGHTVFFTADSQIFLRPFFLCQFYFPLFPSFWYEVLTYTNFVEDLQHNAMHNTIQYTIHNVDFYFLDFGM